MRSKQSPLEDVVGAPTVRQRIVTAARRHFLAHGFRGVTMDDIAAALGMSKKTLYAHFPSKTALLEATVDDKLRSIEADLKRITAECSSDFSACLHQMLACVQEHSGEVQPPFLRDLQREAPEVFQIVQQRRHRVIHTYFGKLLDSGRRDGFIRHDVPVSMILEILLAATEALVNPKRLTELGLTPKQAFSTILSVVLEGAITKGRAKP
jgi:AcrR family transcriptional regulator